MRACCDGGAALLGVAPSLRAWWPIAATAMLWRLPAKVVRNTSRWRVRHSVKQCAIAKRSMCARTCDDGGRRRMPIGRVFGGWGRACLWACLGGLFRGLV